MTTSSDPLQHWRTLPVVYTIMMQWLVTKGVHPLTIGSGQKTPIKFAHGRCAADGWFDPEPSGPACFAFLVEDGAGVIDLAFWDPRSGATATLQQYGFALGEEQIDNPGTYSFDACLKIHADPLDWLRASRDGIVVLDWSRAFDRLRYCPRIAVPPCLLDMFQRAMKPQQMPEVFVLAEDRSAAA